MQMRKEKDRKKILIQLALVVALGIFAVLFFLFSVRGLLLTEAENRLLSINKRQVKEITEIKPLLDGLKEKEQLITHTKVTTTDFGGQVHGFVLDEEGAILAFIGEEARLVGERNENQLGLFLPDTDRENYRSKINREDGSIEKLKLPLGVYYIAIRITDVIPKGYLVSIVPASIVDKEIASIWHIAIVIIILSITTVLFGAVYSIYKRKTHNRRLSKDGKPDFVTGLPHYMVHKSKAQQLINAEQDTYAYVSFSVDKYSLILQLSGKEYCNYLLKSIADILSNWVKEDETLARVHEDLFGMMLKYDDELSFRQRLIRMFKHAGDIPNTENNFCNVTFRSGVCLVEGETDIDKVIARAKRARIRRDGGLVANIEFFQSKTNKRNLEMIVKEAESAVYEQRLLVYLQPKFRMESNKISGAEALVRWNHPKYGFLTPNVFLPLLEENGLITQIDFFVLETVCKQVREWLNRDLKVLPISVNLSIKQLENHLFIQKLIEIVDQYEVPHELIEFEFPESAVYDKVNELLSSMKQLYYLGFILSIDNVGAGFSAIHMLKELPIHIIKIDKGLIKDYEDIEFTDKDRTLVTHIISYAKTMNLEVLAGGVETKDQKDMLEAQSCDMVQGYYYHRPMPLNEFEKLLEA